MLDALTRGGQLQSLCSGLPRFRRIAISRLFEGSIRLRGCTTLFVVGSDGRVHRPLGHFPRLAHMTSVCLGVGCQSKALVLVTGLARKPLLLFRHRRRVRADKGKTIESTAEF